MTYHLGIFTNEEWKQGSGPVFSSRNAATQEIVWRGHAASTEDVDQVIKNARKAYKEWCSLTIDERSQYLENFAKIVESKKDALAETISKETGKPLWESRIEIGSMMAKVGISLEAYGRRCAGMIKELGYARSITRHKPHGVIGVMGPFNFPGHLPSGHIIPALLAGNTVVFKPSELAPLVAEETAKCWEQSGLPPGIFNLVQGGHETGQALVTHSDINGIFFTGSYKTGKWISETLAGQPEKIVALEMGGNNPLVIGEVNNPLAAAYITIQSAYLTTGQRCTCARRLIVVLEKNNKAYLDNLKEMIKTLRIGAYTDKPEPYIGPLVLEEHAKWVLQAQENLSARGGNILVECKQLKEGTGFISPGLIDVTDIEDKPDIEIFGPLLQLTYVQDLDQAIREANNTKYGLSAGLLSDNPDEFAKFYRDVRAGIVNWNTPLTGASSSAPFGGIGRSGNHRPSAYYAVDYCSYPIASMELSNVKMPDQIAPGVNIQNSSNHKAVETA